MKFILATLVATAALFNEATACDNEWFVDDCLGKWYREPCAYELNDPDHCGWFYWDDASQSAYWLWCEQHDSLCSDDDEEYCPTDEWFMDDCLGKWYREPCANELNDPDHCGWFYWDDVSYGSYWLWCDQQQHLCQLGDLGCHTDQWMWDPCYEEQFRIPCDFELADPDHCGWFYWDDDNEVQYWRWCDERQKYCTCDKNWWWDDCKDEYYRGACDYELNDPDSCGWFFRDDDNDVQYWVSCDEYQDYCICDHEWQLFPYCGGRGRWTSDSEFREPCNYELADLGDNNCGWVVRDDWWAQEEDLYWVTCAEWDEACNIYV